MHFSGLNSLDVLTLDGSREEVVMAFEDVVASANQGGVAVAIAPVATLAQQVFAFKDLWDQDVISAMLQVDLMRPANLAFVDSAVSHRIRSSMNDGLWLFFSFVHHVGREEGFWHL